MLRPSRFHVETFQVLEWGKKLIPSRFSKPGRKKEGKEGVETFQVSCCVETFQVLKTWKVSRSSFGEEKR
jgi:hypothetical protein